MWVVVDWNKSNKSNQLTTKFSNSASDLTYGQMYLCIVFVSFPPNSPKRVVSLGGVGTQKCECPEVMLKLGRRGEQIKLLHFVPHFHSNLRGHAKKNSMTQVFGWSWRKNAKCMPCMAHHLLSLPIWVNGSERRLQAMQRDLCEEGYIYFLFRSVSNITVYVIST